MSGILQGVLASIGAAKAVYIEDTFSTYLYTGNSSSQTITNGIDLAGEGGLVWCKSRGIGYQHILSNTTDSFYSALQTNSAAAAQNGIGYLSSPSSTGFTLGATAAINSSGDPCVSWTFRKAPKFFDVVTYTGNGAISRNIAHNLGSVPGMIIVKCTSNANTNWLVYHSSLGPSKYLVLDNTQNAINGPDYWDNTAPTSTTFTLGQGYGDGLTNASGRTYVAYLFAHDAGGFGLSGNDNVISCGSFTTDGSGNATVNLGWEPQYILYKLTNTTGQWYIEDTMRGLYAQSSIGNTLIANLSNAEGAGNGSLWINSTGFTTKSGGSNLGANNTVIYMAIRRPMKPPTSGTQVFLPSTTTSALDSSTPNNRMLAATDLWINYQRSGGTNLVLDRLRGWLYLQTYSTAPENSGYTWSQTNQTTLSIPASSPSTSVWTAGTSQVDWYFKRATGFFDIVCYTGTGSARTVAHNLGVPPDLMIIKCRNAAVTLWYVYVRPIYGTSVAGFPGADLLVLSGTSSASYGNGLINNTQPTSSVFSLGSSAQVNGSGSTFVNYLFASLPGVSKVGSYTGTGTGTTQTINCGFTTGARFVLIKRADAAGDWYAWDSARGIVASNDPYLLLNSNTAEVTNTDFIDANSTGFEISSTAPAGINANGGTFIFLAIA